MVGGIGSVDGGYESWRVSMSRGGESDKMVESGTVGGGIWIWSWSWSMEKDCSAYAL